MPKYDLRFDLVETKGQRTQLADFLRNNVGNYDAERHTSWVEETCMPAIERDDRRALAWWQHGHMVGDAVIKPLKTGVAEIKNFRIRSGNEGYRLGAVMMAHAVTEARDVLTDKGLASGDHMTLQLDTNPKLAPYFAQYGFEATATAELYQPGTIEVIMQRIVRLD